MGDCRFELERNVLDELLLHLLVPLFELVHVYFLKHLQIATAALA